ncbi:MAG: PEPxxWA-CTERM sorting domain-containing protein [Phenylobacterium sp.]|nr:PEPxxWA-CTERM sorting domain-containing protein [Phenylobacterium sp.]
MVFKRFVAIAAFAAVVSAQPVAAAVIDLKFQEFAGASVNTQNFGPTVYHEWQNQFHAASFSGDYDFHFTYDTAATGPNYALTLVSGRVGTFSDFSLWTPTLSFAADNTLMIRLERSVVTGASYLSGVYFLMQDNDGDIGPTLPTALALADLDTATASFENRRSGGVGMGYKNVGYSKFGGAIEVPLGAGDPPVGGVPEPGTWALMILGFGGAGVMLRRRRLLVA